MNSNFDISYKRKMLYKRKRKRQLILKITLFLIGTSILSIILLLNRSTPVNKKVISSSSENPLIVCIDPGHGDFDTGAKSSSGVLEKDIVLDISLKIGKFLEEENIKVIYTRTNDSLPWIDTANDSLKERIRIAKAFKADIFLSIHCNSNYDDTTAKGIETWYKSKDNDSKNLALSIQDSLANLNSSNDRGVKTYDKKDDALAVLELNESISALIELGFLSNTYDEKYLNSTKGKEDSAKAIKDGLMNYINSNKDIIIQKRSNKAM